MALFGLWAKFDLLLALEKKKNYWGKAIPLIYILSSQEENWEAVTEIVWSTKTNIFTIWPLTEIVERSR